MEKKTYVWRDRKRTLFGLPLSFTVYKLTEENDNQLAAAVTALSAKEGEPYVEKVGFFESDAFLWMLFGILAAALLALCVLLVLLLNRKKNERDFFTEPQGDGSDTDL